MEAKEDVRRSTVYDSRRDRYPRSAPHPLDMGRKLEDRFCLSHRRQAHRSSRAPWAGVSSDARAKSEASLRRHTFLRYPTRVWKFERLSLSVARFPTR